MRKKVCILLLGAMLFINQAEYVFAETEDGSKGASDGTGNVITTGTQEGAIENQTDVDEDIRGELQAEIPDEIEEISIASTEDFLRFAENCRLDTWSVNKKVTLTKDISLLGIDFEGIATFGGSFDGMGHTISEVNIGSGVSYAGLFSSVQKTAVISNLKVVGTIIPSGNQIALGGIAADNAGLIRNCSFEGVISGSDYVGGIAGINELSGDIRSCKVSGYVHGTHFTGGVAGENMGNIFSCTNESLVNTTNTDTQITIDAMSTLNKVLGLIKNGESSSEEANADVTMSDAGGIAGLSIGIISRCINDGDVGYEHVGYNVGGIAGRQSGYIYKCTNNATILGRKDVGGIVGQAEPYITVDLSSDIAYQLSEAISKLHDIVTATLNDTKNQSDKITGRLAAIQQFTSGAIEDVRYIANGTVDYANGVSGAATEAFSRIDYVLDESSKKDGLMDKADSAAGNAKDAAESLYDSVSHLNIESYLSGDELQQYQDARAVLASAASQYSSNYAKAYTPYYNYYVYNGKSSVENIDYILSSTGEASDYSGWSETNVPNDIENETGTAQSGSWQHEDGTAFPVTDEEDTKYSADSSLASSARGSANSSADNYAKKIAYKSDIYNNTGDNRYDDDIAQATAVITTITQKYLPLMTADARSDALSALNSIEDAADDLNAAGDDAKSIVRNIAGRDNITFPQFSAEYKAHTTSLADNMQGMNDNFGLLNSELNSATGVLVDDLEAMSDQFNTIMLLYTDAIDGVLDMDYTTAYEDVSLEEAENCTDATIDDCINYGKAYGDIDTGGIAGTMAIEYDFDAESDITGIKDSRLNTSYITKCVLRGNKNYGDAVSEKSYAGGACGLQEMGTIINCSNLGNIRSDSGEYVGGVCGSSLSYIVNSRSRGILSGGSYVGGIAGDGMHIRDCMSLVKIEDASSWFGAVAGHVDDEGTVRNNFFISDELAGIDRASYALKAEPMTYDAEELPYDFNSLTISFVLNDEDADEESLLIKKVNKKYGEALDESEYPKVDEKEGYYVSWDKESIDEVKNDEVVTASYVRYRTTIAEEQQGDELHQSEILIDGSFREGDELTVERTVNYDADTLGERITNLKEFEDYETLKVTIPDDGQKVHQMRFKPDSDIYSLFDHFDIYLSGEDGDTRLNKTGSMGEYDTYEVEGNELVLNVRFTGADKTIGKYALIILGILIGVVAFIIVMTLLIKRHKGKLPKIFNRFVVKVSEKIENKEQLFYDESKDEEKDSDKK